MKWDAKEHYEATYWIESLDVRRMKDASFVTWSAKGSHFLNLIAENAFSSVCNASLCVYFAIFILMEQGIPLELLQASFWRIERDSDNHRTSKHMSRHVLTCFRYLCFKCGYKAMLNIAMEPKFPSTYNFSTFLESNSCFHKRGKFYTYVWY